MIYSKNFFDISKNVLSNGKSDPRFKPSQDSCLLRIPGSLNGKFLDNRDKRLSGNFKVKVLQEWNGKRAVISDDFLADFRIYLIDRKIKEIKENNKNNVITLVLIIQIIIIIIDGSKNYYKHQYTILEN